MGKTAQQSYEERFSHFASELRNHIDDEAMLQEIHKAIKAMLAGDDASEKEIRSVLQKHHDEGVRRDESYQLVQKLIDSIVTEDVPTESNIMPDEDGDPFSSTTVIPTVTLSPALADQRLQVGSVLRDRFMLAEELPGGNMGTVYKALDRRLAEADEEEHWVAIKVLSPKLSYDADALRALQQEAVKTRCLTHPNIVRFIDLDRDDDLYFMVMEWLDGQSLADILDDKAKEPIDLDRALDIVRQIGHALDYAHLRGVIHADVKPGNIMITPSGQAKLFDFGIARIRQKQGASRSKKDPGTLNAATPAYSSMQVLTGEEPVAADDVFSLACLAYRLIAGYRVFGPRNAAEAAEAGMEPQRLENLSDSQWKVLKKALSYSRVARYSSSAEFVKALTASNGFPAEGVELAPESDETYIEEFDTNRRRPWRYVALALIFAAAGAVVFEENLIQLIRPYLNETAQMPAPERAVPDNQELQEQPTNDLAVPVEEELIDEPPSETPGTDVAEQYSEPAAVEPEVPREAGNALDPEMPTVVDQNPIPESVQPEEVESNAVEGTAPDMPFTEFSSLPAANVVLPLAGPGDLPGASTITMVEDGNETIVDFVRGSNLEEALQLRLIEKSHSGAQSPLEAGQYRLSNGGLLDFPAGQHRARLIISMQSDSQRESDYRVSLVVVDANYDDIEFANIRLTLQDDDQRLFEKRMGPNTVSFSTDRIDVRERDVAVQVDIIRYRADDTRQEAAYRIRDINATEGEDYIAPVSGSVFFGPGERTVRMLIPLIQDSSRESAESFVIELVGESSQQEGNIYRQITVMIRDDDS